MTSTHPLPTRDLALPAGSLILVTGATGYIASHVVREALSLGYRVRGTSRTQAKADISGQTTQTNNPNYETVVIPDIAGPDAFSAAVLEGVDGIIHVATDMSFSNEPAEVLRTARGSTVNILKAAAEVPNSKVKRVVITSSSSAAVIPTPNKVFHIDEKTWTDGPAKMVNDYLANPSSVERPIDFVIYAASKFAAERAAWDFMASHKPKFVLNTVLPNYNMGRILPGVGYSLTPQSIIEAMHGKPNVALLSSQYYINVEDDAKVHLGALLDKTVNGRRLYAFAQPFDWNQIIEILREVRPDVKTVPTQKFEGYGQDLSTVENGLAKALLKKWFGQDGWKSLKTSVVETIEGH